MTASWVALQQFDARSVGWTRMLLRRHEQCMDVRLARQGRHSEYQEQASRLDSRGNILKQVAQRYASTVAPFLRSRLRTADVLPPSDVSTQALYLWATAIISSYSFTIGDDR